MLSNCRTRTPCREVTHPESSYSVAPTQLLQTYFKNSENGYAPLIDFATKLNSDAIIEVEISFKKDGLFSQEYVYFKGSDNHEYKIEKELIPADCILGTAPKQTIKLSVNKDDADHYTRIALLNTKGQARWALQVKVQDSKVEAINFIEYVENYKYSEHDTYTGRLLAGKPDGYGEVTFKNRYTQQGKYAGEFKGGLMHGTGKLELPGAEFKSQCHGKMVLEGWWGGLTYTGEFKGGLRHGQGSIIWGDGRKYDGEFQDDKMDGEGVVTWPNGVACKGNFKYALRLADGKGTLTWPEGKTYTGDLRDVIVMHGKGTLTWPDGKTYVGVFRDGCMHGEGTLTESDGKTYTGTFEFNKFKNKESDCIVM